MIVQVAQFVLECVTVQVESQATPLPTPE